MYALTVRQPWASALFGPKTIETRTHDRFRPVIGKPIAIHAARQREPLTIEQAVACGWDEEYLLERWPDLFDPESDLPAMAVIGTAFALQGRTLGLNDTKAAMADCSAGNLYGLVLVKRRLFPEPIPCKGQQGLWYWDEPDFVRREGYFPEEA